MKAPLSWIKDFIEIDIPLEELAYRLTMAGLEVEEIQYIGLPLPKSRIAGRSGAHTRNVTKISGFEWDPTKIVVAAILEVMPHPKADRLVLCRLNDGLREHIVLTGAPNLFAYKNLGPLDQPLKVAYAREGAQIYDGHQPGKVLTTLKRATIRGVTSYSMACSEKELGISDDHEGIIILDNSARTGMPLVDYMGDAVLDIAITPNIARTTNILGIAREIAAITGKPLHLPGLDIIETEECTLGKPIEGRVSIDIKDPQLNPRFVLGLIEQVQIRPSPYEVQRRLRLAGMRPINNVVDATNYVMLELGQPLHAFDYDVLLARSGGKAPTIITRTALPGETISTLDNIERQLDSFTVLVCDTSGALSIAGVMGGAESEVKSSTCNILLEGAAWNFINIRRTLSAQGLSSEAAYRFSRGVHPAMAERGVLRCLQLMGKWSGGIIALGLVDNYPLPQRDPLVEIKPSDVKRWLGIQLSSKEISQILERLGFSCEISINSIRVTTPDHRLDIGEGIVGVADLMEEIARIYGYDQIPETRLADTLPPQLSNQSLENEDRIREVLVNLGLQEIITYRMTSPERESLLIANGDYLISSENKGYVSLVNPMVADRSVMRRSLLASALEVVERNARLQDHLAFFELGPVFIPEEKCELPKENQRLVVVLSGLRYPSFWQQGETGTMDFYDIKGVVKKLFENLHLHAISFHPEQLGTFHPERCARVCIAEKTVGVIGELHPAIQLKYSLPEEPVMAAEFDLDIILQNIPERFVTKPVPVFPPVLEDLAIVIADDIPAIKVEEIIHQVGGETVVSIKLFDVFRGKQVGTGLKSLAYKLTYQAPDRTLTDKEVASLRERIVRKLGQELGAKLRS